MCLLTSSLQSKKKLNKKEKMKHLSIIISSLILYSCSNSKIDLTPLKYDESVKIEIAYDIKNRRRQPRR